MKIGKREERRKEKREEEEEKTWMELKKNTNTDLIQCCHMEHTTLNRLIYFYSNQFMYL